MIAQLDKYYLKIAKNRIFARLISYLFYEGRPLTTKGRWINSLVFLNFQIFSRISAPRKVFKPIFIVGTGRSGSTILGKLFSIHQQVGFLNEPKALWYYLNEKDDIIGSYSKRKVGQYYFSEKEATQKIRKKAHNIYGWYLFFTGNYRIVDKYPEHLFRRDYIQSIFGDAKFILLVRNGKDTSQSIATWSDTKGIQQQGETTDWWGKNNLKWQYLVNQVATKDNYLRTKLIDIININNPVQKGEIEWLVTMKEILKAKESKNTYFIRYEDLIKEPEKEITALFDFADLSRNEQVITYSNASLNLPATKASLKISPLIQTEFDKTIQQLGY